MEKFIAFINKHERAVFKIVFGLAFLMIVINLFYLAGQ
jgi:hypothetical protein